MKEHQMIIITKARSIQMRHGILRTKRPWNKSLYRLLDQKIAQGIKHLRIKIKQKKELFFYSFSHHFLQIMTEHADKVSELAYFFVPAALSFLRSSLREIVSSVDSGLVRSYINLMNYLIYTFKVQEGKAFPGKIFVYPHRYKSLEDAIDVITFDYYEGSSDY